MDRRTQLKGLLTKAWNTGKFSSYDEFCTFYKEEFCYKYQINFGDYVVLFSYLVKVCSKPPKKSKPVKKEHNEWYVYFYFTKDNLDIPKYIGKTYNIQNRLNQHQASDDKFKDIDYILYCKFTTERDALDFEAYYTRYLWPPWNIDNKDAPSKLYQLPTQKVFAWAPVIYGSEVGTTKEHKVIHMVEFELNTLVPRFQEIINSISIKE